MFNGIIKNTGKLKQIYKRDNNCVIEILSKMKFSKKEVGSSISCSGACLTLENFNKNLIKFYVSKETLNKTIFKSSKKGDVINLEKSLKYGDRISGHYVQGHVDSTAVIQKISIFDKSWTIKLKLNNKKLHKLLIEKASISINGVSLTISKVGKSYFEVTIIPHTLKLTNLIKCKVKDLVNIEIDIFSKYILKIKR